MTIEATLESIEHKVNSIFAHLTGGGAPPPSTPAPVPRGRGRPPKVAEAPAVPAAAAVAQVPPPILDDVRKALTDLKEVTDQDAALAIMAKVGEVTNLSALKPEKFAAVIAAAQAAMPPKAVEEADPFETPAPAVEVDPFETAAPTAAVVVETAPTLEDVKAAIVEGQKRMATDAVQKVVMDHGGKGPKEGGGEGPSLKALKVSQYATVIAGIKALPTTK